MNRRLLTYLFISLFVLQLQGSVFDVHAIHQTSIAHFSDNLLENGSVHKNLNHSHATSLKHINALDNQVTRFDLNKVIDSDASHQNEDGCDHCCLCHGHLSTGIVISAAIHTIQKPQLTAPDYHSNLIPSPIASILRPPIV